MTVEELSMFKMPQDEMMPRDKMTVDVLSLEKMTVGELSVNKMP